MKKKIGDMIGHHVVTVSRGPESDLVIEGMGGHQERAVHPAVRVPAECCRVGKKLGNIGDFADVDIFLDMMEIIIVPMCRERVGIKNK